MVAASAAARLCCRRSPGATADHEQPQRLGARYPLLTYHCRDAQGLDIRGQEGLLHRSNIIALLKTCL